MSNDIDNCRVCGYNYGEPWGKDGTDPSFEICLCCGVEFGYGDATLVAVKRTRGIWLASGTKWVYPKFKPQDWDVSQQMNQIPGAWK